MQVVFEVHPKMFELFNHGVCYHYVLLVNMFINPTFLWNTQNHTWKFILELLLWIFLRGSNDSPRNIPSPIKHLSLTVNKRYVVSKLVSSGRTISKFSSNLKNFRIEDWLMILFDKVWKERFTVFIRIRMKSFLNW